MSYGWYEVFKYSFRLRQSDARTKHKFFKDYIDSVSEKINSEKEVFDNEFNKAIDKAKVSADEEEMDSLISYFEEISQQFYEFNPSILYGSIFLSLYAYLEGTLKGCYDDLINHFDYPPEGPSKKKVVHYKGYINKYSLYNFSTEKEKYKFIQDCEVIRDKIIHTNGEMPLAELDMVRPILSKFPSISIRETKFWIVDKSLVLDLNDAIRDVVEPLCGHLYATVDAYPRI